MKERYEKHGTSVRLEKSARGESLITLRESGWSAWSGRRFSCGPLASEGRELPRLSPDDQRAVRTNVERLSRGRAAIERLTVVEGSAIHHFAAGSISRRWEERAARLFVTLVRQQCGRRVSLSLGAQSLGLLELSPLDVICQALSRPEGSSPPHSDLVTIEPWVAASLIRTLADHRVELPGELRLVQEPPEGARDGRGSRLRRRIVRRSPPTWPDSFRPSYRVAPVLTPLHVDLLGTTHLDEEPRSTVVALASEWSHRAHKLVARAWVTDQTDTTVSLRELAIDTRSLSRATLLGSDERHWFPEGAGAWGRRLTVRQPAPFLRSL